MELYDFKRTKLAKSYFSSHVYEIATNMTLTFGIISILVAFSPLAVALMFAVYALLALSLSFVIIVITVGLVFADHSNGLYKLLVGIWSVFDWFNMEKIVVVQQVALPIVLSITGVFFVTTFIFTCVDKNRPNKGKPIAFLVVTLILAIVSLFIYLMSKGGQA